MKYLIQILPVTENINKVRRVLVEIVGHKSEEKISNLIRHGGILKENLTQGEAGKIASKLMQIFLNYKVLQMPEDEFDTYRVTIIHPGSRKLNVIRKVKDITELGLKDAKDLVDNLGEVGIYKNRKEADHVKEILTLAGAKVSIEILSGLITDPEPMPAIENPILVEEQINSHKIELGSSRKITVAFDEETKIITIYTPFGNCITMDEQSARLEITDQNNNLLEMEPGGITMESPGNITLKANGNIDIQATAALTIGGAKIALSAQASMEISGATAKLAGSGITEIKGSLIKIN